MREFAAAAAAGGGGAKRQRPLFLIFSALGSQYVYSKSVESESLQRKEEGATAGIRQKKKNQKRKRIKSPFQSSQTASDPPSGKGATSLSETRAPPRVSLYFLPSCICVFIHSLIGIQRKFYYFPIFLKEKEEFEKKKCCCLEFAQQSVTKQENGNTRSASRPVSDSFRHIHRISSYATHKMTKRNKTGTFLPRFLFCIFQLFVNFAQSRLVR